MATVTLALPNMIDGALVEVDGLGIFKNGETSDLDDDVVQVYIAQRANSDGYAFRNGSGITFGGLDDHLYPEEVIPQVESSYKMPGEVVHLDSAGAPVDLDAMTLPQLHDYAEQHKMIIPDNVRLKNDVKAFLKDGTLPEGAS